MLNCGKKVYYKDAQTNEIKIWTEASGDVNPLLCGNVPLCKKEMEQVHVKWLLDYLTLPTWTVYYNLNHESLMYLIQEGSYENFGRRSGLYEFMRFTFEPTGAILPEAFNRDELHRELVDVRRFLTPMLDAQPQNPTKSCKICSKEIDAGTFVTCDEALFYHEKCWFNYRMYG